MKEGLFTRGIFKGEQADNRLEQLPGQLRMWLFHNVDWKPT